MEDVQSHPPHIAMPIDRVGIRELQLPLRVRDRSHGTQQTVASVDLGVDLPSAYKGTHMSRFVEALQHWDDGICYQSVRGLLQSIKEKLDAQRAYARFHFPYFISKSAPASLSPAPMAYQCTITAELDDKGQFFLLAIDVPVMTVCPCSKAISNEGAHSQRALIHLHLRLRAFAWIEEFIELAESAGSSALYTLLKREDEKFVTEYAFAHPAFVEDVVRTVAQKLSQHAQVEWFRVEVESMESIHNHNAFACIERDLRRKHSQKNSSMQI
jgi:GTP cyclohydrolase I